MQYALCRHIKTNGPQCEAPSLSNDQWCFFHSRLHQRHSRFRPIEVASDSIVRAQPVHLSALEDRESVQVALSVVINALASGQMEPRQATALLYGLQIASSNLARMTLKPQPVQSRPLRRTHLRRPIPRRTRSRLRDLRRTPAKLHMDDFEEDEDEDQEEEDDDTPIERWIDPRSR